MWNAREITELHEEVKREYGLEEPDIDMRITLYIMSIEGLIYECLEWISRPMIGSNGRFDGGLFKFVHLFVFLPLQPMVAVFPQPGRGL
jgi:hypothetical protein